MQQPADGAARSATEHEFPVDGLGDMLRHGSESTSRETRDQPSEGFGKQSEGCERDAGQRASFEPRGYRHRLEQDRAEDRTGGKAGEGFDEDAEDGWTDGDPESMQVSDSQHNRHGFSWHVFPEMTEEVGIRTVPHRNRQLKIGQRLKPRDSGREEGGQCQHPTGYQRQPPHSIPREDLGRCSQLFDRCFDGEGQKDSDQNEDGSLNQPTCEGPFAAHRGKLGNGSLRIVQGIVQDRGVRDRIPEERNGCFQR